MKQIKECQVCGKEVVVFAYKDCKCKNCGWIQNDLSVKNPNKLCYPNITTLNNAKMLQNKGLKIKPTFEDFIQSVDQNLESSFKYKKRHYGSTQFDGYEFYEWNKLEGYQTYQTIEEFVEKVNIDGRLLKDIWEDVYQFEYEC